METIKPANISSFSGSASTASPQNTNRDRDIAETLNVLNSVVLGSQATTKLALCCLFAGGHLLLEDLPGLGKTTLAHTLAKTLGLEFNRVQFTNDLLPADLLGVSIFDSHSNTFKFKAGPIFTSVLLADEINRASPKTQSALLQAMEEKRISMDGKTRPLGKPFFVIATQNPSEQSGTFPLPESQLDRFLMRLSLGYPDTESELNLLQNNNAYQNSASRTIPQTLSADTLNAIAEQVIKIHCSQALAAYIQRLLIATRQHDAFTHGLSPRAGIQWVQASKAWAFLEGRDFIIPEDVQAVASAVAVHRLQTASANTAHTVKLIEELIERTPIN